MAFEFTETLTIELPKLDEHSLDTFIESPTNMAPQQVLITQIAAIHEGVTQNFNRYTKENLAESVTSWWNPYPKPIILNHDVHTEPLGRVIGASMAQEEDGTPHIAIQAVILDPQAVEKVRDKRYLTGSVGGMAEQALCTICGVDWANPKEGMGLPCAHRRGRMYKEQLAALEMVGIGWREYSFVNVPSDSSSGIRGFSQAGSNPMLTESTPARFFAFDMGKQNIVEFLRPTEESQEKLLEWNNFRDTIQSVIVDYGISSKDCDFNSDDDTSHVKSQESLMAENDEDNQMTEATDELTDTADILSTDDAPKVDAPEAPTEDADAPDSAKVSDEDAVNEDAEPQEDARPEGQEKPHAKDVDSEGPNPQLPASREENANEDGKVTEDTNEDGADDLEVFEAANDLDADKEPVKTEEEVQDSQEVTELKAQIEELEGQNERLRNLLKRSLVERVLDAQSVRGILEGDRQELREDYMSRTANSLVDTLRDVSAKPIPAVVSPEDIPKVASEATAVVEPKDAPVVEEQDDEVVLEDHKPNPIKVAEDIFTNRLMGRYAK